MTTSGSTKRADWLIHAVTVLLLVEFCTIAPVCAATEEERTVLIKAAQAALGEGEFEEAEDNMRMVLERAPSKETGGKAVDLQNMALILYLQGNFKDAIKMYNAALPLTETCWGSSSLAVADNLYGIIRTLRRAGQYSEAEPHILRLIDIRTQHLGTGHKSVGNSLMDLAVNYERQGKFESAEHAYEKALLVKENEFGKDSRDNIPYLKQFANLLAKTGKSSASVEDKIRYLDTKPSTKSPQDNSDKSGWLHWPRPADAPSISNLRN